MRKFKVKNRQKRKYTRHSGPQSSYQFSPLVAGILPTVILAITFIAMLLMNMNLREPANITVPQPTFAPPSISIPTLTIPTISLNELFQPIRNLPNLFAQPVAFLIGMVELVSDSIQFILTSFVAGLEQLAIMLDPRPMFVSIGQGSIAAASSAGAAGVSIVDAVANMFANIFGSIAYAGVQIGNGMQIAGNAIVSAFLYVLELLGMAFWFLVNGIVQIVLFLFNGFISIVTTIANAISAFINKVVSIILIPFQVIGAFWMMVKPYVDTLLYYCGLAVNDMGQGFNNLANLGSILQE